MIAEILVGVDRSSPSRSALRWGVDRARLVGASVSIVHVRETPSREVSDWRRGETHADAWAFVNGELDYAREREPGLVISATVADGDPADELVDIARGAELVVVGTHKTGFVQGKVFGSKFLALVRESATASAFIPDSSGSFRRGVVAPLDVSVRGLVLIRFAAAEAARTSQDLVLVWSSPHPIGASSTSSAPAGAGEPAYIEQLAVASAAARLHNDGLRITGRYERVPLADALLRASSAAAVLVLGIARYDRLSSAAHDRVVFDVLLNIASPVIVIHDETASTADTRPTHQTRPTDQTRPAHENRGEPNG